MNPGIPMPAGVKPPRAELLRPAAAEALLAGSLLLADINGGIAQWSQKPNSERFLKALEGLREALS